MSKPAIGFIGLGLMGSAMVNRLIDLGYLLTVIANRSREAVDKAVSRGAREVKTSREVAANSNIIMLCMDTSDSVEARMLGNDGVIAGLVGGGGLGLETVNALRRSDSVGTGFEAGIAIVLLAAILDRITRAIADRASPPPAVR